MSMNYFQLYLSAANIMLPNDSKIKQIKPGKKVLPMTSPLPSNFHTQRRYTACLNLCPAVIYMEVTWRKVDRDVASQVSSGAPGPQIL